jgi:chemotaxis protein MotB
VLRAAEEALQRQVEQGIAQQAELQSVLTGTVGQLARYRSEFFARLGAAVGGREDVRVVGDRFVVQAEILFDSGSAELGTEGKAALSNVARTILEVAPMIPTGINWVLRVDGHTDSVPIHSAAFASNWELSTARAISVVEYLTSQGVPPEHLAATGFGEFQPIDNGTDEAARRRNRRIELKLTER